MCSEVRVQGRRRVQGKGLCPRGICLPLSPLSVAQDNSDRVLRGAECTPHPQPWQVALFEHGRFNRGGSLISPRRAPSAARCQTRYEGLGSRGAVAGASGHLRITDWEEKSWSLRTEFQVPLSTRCPQPSEARGVSGWGLVSDNKRGATGSPASQGGSPRA
ncbi:kallikrein-15-like [Kogia breviceps]|uniref:kallikrein-15-like n=1 Tax=Kogia breviceps TaxID=27615 RepID=UPI0034D2FAE5